MTDDLAPVLRRLPEPEAPATITATVMARIAREEEERAAAAPAPRRERPAWVWAVVGAGLIVGLRLYGWIAGGVPPDVTTPRIGLEHLPVMPAPGPVSTVMAVGLLIYLAGLFSPLRRRRT